MKKFLTVALALTMALALASPALAFTSVEYDDDSTSPQLAIKLVDVDPGFVSINFTAPPSNRGYLKNEVVCAVVSLLVPKGYNFDDNNYTALEFTGTNTSLYQDDNFYASLGTGATLNYMSRNAYDALRSGGYFSYSSGMSWDNTITLDSGGLAALDYSGTSGLKQDTTYHFAIFGKVVADDAWMRASLVGLGGLFNSTDNDSSTGMFNIVEINDDYAVGYHNPNRTAYNGSEADGISNATVENMLKTADSEIPLSGGDIAYIVFDDNGSTYDIADAYFVIITDKNFNCKSMYVHYPNNDQRWYLVKVVGRNYDAAEYARFWDCYVQFEYFDTNNWVIKEKGVETSYMLRYICEDIIYDDFGLNPALKGQMKDSWWSQNKEISVEVAIEPWYAEVTVPTEIELEPPKTGDAISAMGLILVMFSGLGLAAAKKLRATNS